MLQINNLNFTYPKSETSTLNNISLQFSTNKIHGIVGSNGAGKTTFLNCVAQYNKTYEGKISLNNHSYTLKDVAFLETTPFFYPYLKGGEFLDLFKLSEDKKNNLSTLFDVDFNKPISSFSTGMKKKLALIAMLSMNRPILILDEPFNGLDLESTQLVEHIIKKTANEHKIILMTSHIIETLYNCCDNAHQLEEGKIKRSFVRSEFDILKKELSDNQLNKSEQIIGLLGL